MRALWFMFFMVQAVMIRIVWSVCHHIRWLFVINLLFWRSALWSVLFFLLLFCIIYHQFDLFLILFSLTLRIIFMASARHLDTKQKDMQFVHFNEMRTSRTHSNNRKNRRLEVSESERKKQRQWDKEWHSIEEIEMQWTNRMGGQLVYFIAVVIIFYFPFCCGNWNSIFSFVHFGEIDN